MFPIRNAALFLLLASSLVSFCQEEQKAPASPLVEASLDFASRYIWRGYDLNHSDPVLQPSVTFNPPVLPGFSANLFSSVGLIPDSNRGDSHTTFDEFDISLAYQRDVIPSVLTASAGFLWYNYTSAWASGHGVNRNDFELTIRLDYQIRPYFVPYIAYFRGLDSGIRGNYLEFGVTGYRELSSHWSIAPAVQSAFTDQYALGGKLSYVALLVPATCQFGKLGITPYFNLFLPLEDLNGDRRKVIPVEGVRLAYRF